MERGVDRDSLHTELFFAGTPAPRPTTASGTGTSNRVLIMLAGRETPVATHSAEFVLDAVIRARPDAPYACKGGVCGTCRAKVIGGEVEMTSNYALEEDEVSAGYVLTCRTVIKSPAAHLDYDA